jgi:signal transduction histidine kinase
MSNKSLTLHLQSKVSLTLVLLISSFVLISYLILRMTIAPAFNNLELAGATSDFHRAEGALQTDIENLDAITADWAPWDDIHDYTSGVNPNFIKSNLNRPTLDNLNLDLLAIFGPGRELLWAMTLVDGEEVPAHEFNILNADHPAATDLVSHIDARDGTSGVVQTIKGLMLISSRPILRSDDSGPVNGAVVMGQLLDATHLRRLRDRTEVDISMNSVVPDTLSSFDEKHDLSDNRITVSKPLLDIYGAPILMFTTKTLREISNLGEQTIDAALYLLMTSGLFVCAFIWFMLRTTILRPIENLSTHINDIRESGDLSRQVSMSRNDEIGLLAFQFDTLTTEVHNARQALLDQSFKAGKADTAAEVMHNIRNAMTPMINGIDLIKRSFKVTDSLRVSEALQQLEEPNCAPDRKEKLLQYIDASFNRLDTVSKGALDDLHIVAAQAKQVEGIIADQEKFANVAPVAEDVAVQELLDEALHVIPKGESHSVELALDDIGEVRVSAHRIGLLQVMGNLILNAYESIRRNNSPQGRISLTVSGEVVDDKAMVRVTVRDNGGGFSEDTGLQIFNRGFTSKPKRETNGLGLHWCANAVASMGGRISARSPGEGCGAEFHVMLPAPEGGYS